MTQITFPASPPGADAERGSASSWLQSGLLR